MTVTLAITQQIAAELFAAASAHDESAGVLLTRLITTPSGSVRLLGREIHWVQDDAYIKRSHEELVIASDGYVPALGEAERQQAVPIWLHTHPGVDSTPKPSQRDSLVDEALSSVFRIRSDSEFYGAVIIAKSGSRLTFTGHIESEQSSIEIDRLWITGDRFAYCQNWHQKPTSPQQQFDRNVRAFGGGIQQTLRDLQIAIVGCGGTGSAVIEQLARLGSRHMLVIDPDVISASNLTRVFGSYPDSVGKPKVDVIASHVKRIAPDADIRAVKSSITQEGTARLLLDADIVFGCTDDNAGRLVLSRLPTYALTPVIDCGVLLSSSADGTLDGIDGRVTVIGPGTACLVCRERIDLQLAALEQLELPERQQRVFEGYAPALPGIEPAVVTFTSQVAAFAVSELLERLIQYGPSPAPTEVLLRIHEREISTNIQLPREGHYCHADSGKVGLGLTDTFLEQSWA